MSDPQISQQWYNLGAQAFFLSPCARQAGIAFIRETMAREAEATVIANAQDALDRLQRAEEAHSNWERRSSGQRDLAENMVRLFLQVEVEELQPLGDERLREMRLAYDFDIADRVKTALDDPIAFDIACAFGVIFIKSNEGMPPELKTFIIDVLRQNIKRPAEKRGRSPLENIRRNQTIVKAIEVGQHYGLPAVRNDASDEVSACDIAASELRDMGLSPSTFAEVKRIWMRRGVLNSAFVRTMTGKDV